MFTSPYRRCLRLATCLSIVVAAGCSGNLTSLFNDEFLTQLGVTQRAASLPGSAPAIIIRVENRTTRTIEASVSMRLGGDNVDSFVTVVPPGASTGRAVNCPVTEITLGDIADLDQTGAIVRLGDGTPDDPFVEVEPFGVLFKAGANYDCGDSVTFAVVPSAQTASGYQTIAFVQRAP